MKSEISECRGGTRRWHAGAGIIDNEISEEVLNDDDQQLFNVMCILEG